MLHYCDPEAVATMCAILRAFLRFDYLTLRKRIESLAKNLASIYPPFGRLKPKISFLAAHNIHVFAR